MLNNYRVSRMANAAALAVLLGALVGCAQKGGGSTSTAVGSGATSATASQITDADKEMMNDIVEANLAEIETGKLALSKSKNVHIRAFAQKMIDDHANAMQALQAVARNKGITLPTETDMQHKAMATGLSVLSGDTFDQRYLQHIGVGDHQRTLDLLQKTIRTTNDRDLRAHATQMMPVVEQHLAIAQRMMSMAGAAR